MTRNGSDILREALAAGNAPEVWVRFPRQLGDVVFSLPFFLGLQREWNAVAAEQGRALRWIALGHDIGASLFTDADPAFIAECHLEAGGRNKPDPWRLLERWRRQRPAAVLNLSQSVRLILAATLARVPIRAGIADSRLRVLYTHPMQYRGLANHCAQRFDPLLERLTGLRTLHWEPLSRTQVGGASGLDKLRAAGWDGRPYVCLAFGTRGDSKRWLPERETWPGLAQLFLRQGLAVVWLGSPAESARAHELCALAPGSLDLAGRTSIPEAFAIEHDAYGTVAVDTGLAHLSAAAGRPTLALNGSSPETMIQPIGPFSLMIHGPMLDLRAGESLGWTGFSPSMRRIPAVRAANLLHALAAEAAEAPLSPQGRP